MLEELLETAANFLVNYGYAGVFAISLLGCILPFISVPYLVPIFLISTQLDPILAGLAAGVGGALGKTTSYLLGMSGEKLLSEKQRKRVKFFKRVLDKYGALAIFIFALTPLPDDAIVIPVGVAGYSYWKFLAASSLGRIALSWVVAFTGRYTYMAAESLAGGYVGIAAAVLLTIVAMILVVKIDWVEIVKIVEEEGTFGLVRKAARGELWRKR
ncbi:MAG: VTT domain-containing protein [Candidatus Verstraetearchaeota archaeon]|nr:VTT domain-containing protein [Candidatus Verstraetearchaeota archaeon]